MVAFVTLRGRVPEWSKVLLADSIELLAGNSVGVGEGGAFAATVAAPILSSNPTSEPFIF